MKSSNTPLRLAVGTKRRLFSAFFVLTSFFFLSSFSLADRVIEKVRQEILTASAEQTVDLAAKNQRTHYQFSRAHLRYGAFNPDLDLTRLSDFSSDELEKMIADSMPPTLRQRALPFIPIALELAESYQVDPFWVLAVMWTESHFNPQAESIVRAQGLMQVLPTTAGFIFELQGQKNRELTLDILRDPQVNIDLGVFYLNRLINRFDGNYRLATVAYNMGTTRVLRRLARGQEVGVRNLYLNKVRRAYARLSRNYLEIQEQIPARFLATYVASSEELVKLKGPIASFAYQSADQIYRDLFDDLPLPTLTQQPLLLSALH